MYVNAHKVIEEFTRPIKLISRKLNSTEVIPNCATGLIVNDEGWFLTCKHVGELMILNNQINSNYNNYRNELIAIENIKNLKSNQRKNLIKNLNKKYNYNSEKTIQIKYNIGKWVTGLVDFKWFAHPTLDIMLFKPNFTGSLNCTKFPIFFSGEVMVGKSLCKTGFPFSSFTNFQYDLATDDIQFNSSDTRGAVYFALDGIVSKRFEDTNGNITSFQMGSPGIKGQSGGPIFNSNGIIYGIQYATIILDLDFKSTKKIKLKGKDIEKEENAFMYAGLGVASTEVIKYMDLVGCKYEKIWGK
ncbi:MAG: trypsin-like peptidase domain-containing protein [Bacilli bacterium]|nr:trypsin-like peptidase domain-containing protein [Bacilli bacterium]